MERMPGQKKMVEDLTAFLYHKGYRGKFRLSQPEAGRIQTTASLRNCLEIFLADFQQGGRSDPHFELKTYANGAQNLECTFLMLWDDAKGFLIREMDISDRVSGESRKYRLQDNRQMLGSQSLHGLFPRPKPWDRFRKGKFRP